MYLQSLGSAFPQEAYSQKDCWEMLVAGNVLKKLKPRSVEILQKVLLGDSGIATRRFVLTDPMHMANMGAEDLNSAFEMWAPALGWQALEKACQRAEIQPKDVDALFICTCTGYLCPGLSSYVAERGGLRQDVYLQDIVGLGCGAAIPTLRSAQGFLAANPGATVATIAVEICSAAFYLSDDPAVLISLCLFGDGASAAIWRGADAGRQWKAHNFATMHLPAEREKIRFVNAGGKLKNKLHRSVPKLAGEAVAALYKKHANDCSNVISHGGGRDVIEQIELQLPGCNLSAARFVLSEYGNLSSPAVLIALEHTLEAEGDSPERLWLTSFGAGFSAHCCELRRGGIS